MSRYIIISFAITLAVASTAEAQWLYWVETSRTPFGELATLRKPLSGGVREVVLPFNDLKFSTTGFEGKYAFDEVGGKIYWQQRNSPGDGNSSIWRANLDGTAPEIFVSIPSGANDSFIRGSLRIVRSAGGTVPAVSSWGLGVMLLVILAVGTIVFRRRPLWHS